VIDKFSSSLSSAAKSSARPATTDAATAAPTILPSLGASGAIYSTVVMSTFAFPDAEVALVFPPTPSFPIQYGVGGLVLLDCIGILRGWRYDHPPPPIWVFLTDCADDSARLTGSLTIMRI
jgi:rhomboid-like protein